MTGAWRGGLQLSQAIDLGTTAASSQGFSFPGSTVSTFTKGAWTQAIAATTTDSTWIMVYLQTQISGGIHSAVDIGVGGAGSEVAIISNLLCSSVGQIGARYMFPFSVMAGTRISARLSSSVTFDAIVAGITVLSDTYGSAGTGSAIDTYGVSTATNLGTAVDPGGVANTKGAYSQITASTTSDLSGFHLYLDTQSDTTGAGVVVSWLVDLAVGAAGSEVVILPNLFAVAFESSNFANIYDPLIPFLSIQIPAATRIAVRAQCSSIVSPDRLIGASIYGARL